MATQFISSMNRTESGFHLLVILSLSDGGSSAAELEVIREFLENAFSGKIDLIKEQAFLKALPEEEREGHFSEVAARFYAISSQEDRNRVLDFAMKVVMADNEMKPEENRFINQLYDNWGMD
ncbi:MAG: TerB family tellurite resistance protein [Bacteroidota bacterium]|nr:TerB family tellurite resistance protein [Bacteroidota bacterium]MDX5431853.1 TerB family tellurite resistance protein [Bacteroidota bacterium]MDX5470564.1 TerB family tellurite resistance protein [Bacteroidota bacterium]